MRGDSSSSITFIFSMEKSSDFKISRSLGSICSVGISSEH
jgi:hypothetical protein